MKGMIIYGNPMWGDNERATYCEFINEAYFELNRRASNEISSRLEGTASETSKAICSEDDEYDFKIGALIALMKMCGVEKVVRACNEAFPKERYNTYVAKFEGELHELKKNFDKVKDLKDFYKKNYEDVKEHYGKLGDKNKYLIDDINTKLGYLKEKDKEIEKLREENKDLKKTIAAKGVLNGKLLKDYNAAQSSYEIMVEKSADLMDEVKALKEENEKLKKENYLWENSDKSLRREVKIVRDALNTWKHKYQELRTKNNDLECENYKLKTDCEKLQHGYNVTDKYGPCPADWDGDILNMIFLPGRCCGKQYTFLVDLFKKLDQKKVDAAYKEAYNTTLPVWQKEALRQAYEIRTESKEKTELPRTLDINGITYRKEISLKGLHKAFEIKPLSSKCPSWLDEKKWNYISIDELSFKPSPNLIVLSKREEMWDEILKEGRTPVYVKREDIHDFLEECQVAGIKWSSGKMPMETIPYPMSDGYDGIYFFVMTSLDISKSKKDTKEFRHVMSWWMTDSDEEARNSIKYIRPMRWDLFEKGRLVVKLNPDNYKEFYEKCEAVMGKKPISMVTGPFTVYHGKSGTFHIRPYDDKFPYTHKVVDWEDVR